MLTARTAPAASDSADSAIINISAYKFVRLDQLSERRESWLTFCRDNGLKGTIILSPEGINLFLAGTRAQIDTFMHALNSDPLFSDIQAKESPSGYQPFTRMLVKVKSEIIAFGQAGVSPEVRTSPKLSARELKSWLDEGRPVNLFDVRNDYEVEVGTFRGAIPAGLDNFRDFPDAVRRLPEALRKQPVVMFCTGGIRCEKAGPYMEQQGFEQVYQLDGGILKYFEECGDAHYDGDCFVFDHRVAVSACLEETNHAVCFICQSVVSEDDQKSDRYVAGVSCPHCYVTDEEKTSARLQRLQERLRDICDPLPGSQPYHNSRPLNVPQRFAGMTLVDFLDRWHPHVGRHVWLQRIEDGLIRVAMPRSQRSKAVRNEGDPDELGLRVVADRVVRPGERFEHLQPHTVEPEVSADIQLLHVDDEIIVVAKPAPLPLHPSGRFNRNTLLSILKQLFLPERPMVIHRLDADTSGVVVLSRRRAVTRRLCRLFEQQQVSKEYLARVHGHPAEDEFVCSEPLTAVPGDRGLRTIAGPEEGQHAETRFRVLRRDADGTSLLQVIPVTGRTNQIRAHLWHLGHPIVGDPAYLINREHGTNQSLQPGDPPMCLHAWRLSFPDESGRPRQFTAVPPDWAGTVPETSPQAEAES